VPNSRSLVSLVLLLAVACAAPGTRLRLDGLVVRAEPDPLTKLDTYDAEMLFHLALEEDRKGRPAYARRIYERLLEELPDSGYVLAARFNLGLLHEAAERWSEAAEQYVAIAVIDRPEGEARRASWLDAHFRLAVCVSKLGDWWRAVATFDYILAEDWIPEVQRLEALVGRGIALHEADDVAGAELAFSTALRHYREVSRESRFDDRGLAAEAAFRMGEITRDRYEAVALEFPQSVLVARLEQKCELLLEAQHRYLRAIRFGDAHTVAAAGLRIGALYEGLYDVIVGLEAPNDLSTDQVDIYHDEVRRRVNVLVKKALLAYERSLEVGRRAPSAADWVARLENAIARLQGIYLESETTL
jgi:tetratricopeptide (TPR) repeat protein